MPTEFIYPVSSATTGLPAGHDDIALIGGANKNVACQPGGGRAGPMTHDDDTTTIEATPNGTLKEQALNVDWPPLVGSISAISLAFRTKGAVGAFARNGCYVNAAGTKGSTVITDSSFSGYVNVGPTDATAARPGGGVWSAADVGDQTTIFMEIWLNSGTAAEYLWVTSLWGQLTYSPPGGAFIFTLGLAGLGALPFVGAMDFAHFLRFLSWRRRCHPRHTILTPAEVRQAWDELKAYRWPCFFLPASPA